MASHFWSAQLLSIKRRFKNCLGTLRQSFTSTHFFWQLEDGHTLFDYNVGLNDIVQLLIRSDSEAPTAASVADQDGEVNPCTVSNCKNKVKKTSSGSPSQPSTSSRSFLIDPGIGLYKVCTNFTPVDLILFLESYGFIVSENASSLLSIMI